MKYITTLVFSTLLVAGAVQAAYGTTGPEPKKYFYCSSTNKDSDNKYSTVYACYSGAREFGWEVHQQGNYARCKFVKNTPEQIEKFTVGCANTNTKFYKKGF
ncbi:hypothetical protein H4219_005933 [Mycoemilia scoparia]|uniref:Uncharacterized protein n=1 Tax=Mycoemilia scoparia TaxID=417184 RepID=A0A9W7ZRG3_9FUNG|nr:hypothetical protein H4219_005933 [Mycoemilia scoparia]